MKKYLAGLLTGTALILLQTAPVFSIDTDLSDGPPAARTPRPVGLSARLGGLNEVPALSSPGSGRFKATINAARTEISYVLSFEETESPIFMAHIHVGQDFANGGISIWFCGDPNSPIAKPPVSVPPGLPLCPPNGGTLTGTITAADVIDTAKAQGINTGEFEEFVKMILAGDTYVNVHSVKYPPGEVRGQIHTHGFDGPNN